MAALRIRDTAMSNSLSVANEVEFCVARKIISHADVRDPMEMILSLLHRWLIYKRHCNVRKMHFRLLASSWPSRSSRLAAGGRAR